jgi:hypothetical protein
LRNRGLETPMTTIIAISAAMTPISFGSR